MNIGFDLRAIIGKPLFGSGAPAGVAGYSVNILRELVEQGSEHEFFCFSNSLKKPDLTLITSILKFPNVHLVTMRMPNKLFDPFARFVRRPRIDEVIRHATGNPLDVYISPHFNSTPLSPEVRHVLVIHDLSFEIYPEFYGIRKQYWHWMQNVQRACEQADTVIAVSEHTRRDLVTLYGIDEKKIRVIYSGVDLSSADQHNTPWPDIRKKYHLPAEYFFYLGTLEPRKNIESIIEAFGLFIDSNPQSEYHLVIAGGNGWKYRRIYETARASTHANRIHFIGYIDADDKGSLLQHAQAFVYPSFYEGFGFPPLEALSCDTPAIVAHTSSLPEVVGEYAYYVDPHNIHDIATAFHEVTRHDMPKTKSLKAMPHYSWHNTAQEFWNVLAQ